MNSLQSLVVLSESNSQRKNAQSSLARVKDLCGRRILALISEFPIPIKRPGTDGFLLSISKDFQDITESGV